MNVGENACFFIVYLTESEVILAVNVKMNGLMNHKVHSIDVLVTIQYYVVCRLFSSYRSVCSFNSINILKKIV